MNLFALTVGAASIVNPTQYATVRRSAGYTTADDGSQQPAYRTFNSVPVQVQALSNDEVHQMDGLNIQGNKSAIYAGGDYAGVVRLSGAGGDLFTIGGSVWLVVTVLENWGALGSPDGWVKLALVQQMDSAGAATVCS
jgi:hypothetical protein